MRVEGRDLGTVHPGTQGDIWGAHKDMACASLGALIAMIITGLLNLSLQRDFAREWANSLRIKHPRLLGEDAVARMLKKKNA